MATALNARALGDQESLHFTENNEYVNLRVDELNYSRRATSTANNDYTSNIGKLQWSAQVFLSRLFISIFKATLISYLSFALKSPGIQTMQGMDNMKDISFN